MKRYNVLVQNLLGFILPNVLHRLSGNLKMLLGDNLFWRHKFVMDLKKEKTEESYFDVWRSLKLIISLSILAIRLLILTSGFFNLILALLILTLTLSILKIKYLMLTLTLLILILTLFVLTIMLLIFTLTLLVLTVALIFTLASWIWH
jgi:hypothetical protein